MEQAKAKSIERIVEAYSDTLLRLAMHYTRSLADAQDIVQTVFLQLVRKRPRFVSETHERAWLLRATINASKNHLGTAWRRNTVALDENLRAEELIAPDGVLDAVRALPERERAAIFLYYYERYPVAEIARMLGEPEGTVSSRLHRARKRLGAMLKGEDDA